MRRVVTAGAVATAMFGGCREARPPESLLGCYELELGAFDRPWGYDSDSVYYRPPPLVELAADSGASEGRILVPPGSVPSPHRRASWVAASDSVVMGWTTGFVGLAAILRRSPVGLEGEASPFTDETIGSSMPRAPMKALRVECGAPPRYPLSQMRRVGLPIVMASGAVLQIGSPVPAEIRVEGRRESAIVVGSASGFAAGHEELRLGVGTSDRIGSIRLRYPPDHDVAALRDSLVARLGAWTGSSDYGGARSWDWSGRAESTTLDLFPGERVLLRTGRPY